MSLVILTQSPRFNLFDTKQKVKRAIKKMIGQKRGQDLVTDSLMKGLDDIAYGYHYNVGESQISKEDTVYVNASIAALKWAIQAKKEGKMKKLIVGPVLAISPHDVDGILLDDAIDILIVPSQWVKKFWIYEAPEIEHKIVVWAVGVDSYPLENIPRDTVLIYEKNAPRALCKDIKNTLDNQHISYEIIRYGQYTHNEYMTLLDHTQVMIVLSPSESQGIALLEAWMKDVPTFVWNQGFWEYQGHHWKDAKISAPYLSDACGAFFTERNDFEVTWNIFYAGRNRYTPREYAMSRFTHKNIAEDFLEKCIII